MNKRPCRILALTLLVALAGCYRPSTVADTPASVYRVTEQNTEDLSSGIKVVSRVGDYVLQSTNLQIVVNGDLVSGQRDYFGVPSGGAILDLCTRYVDVFSQTRSSNDDTINQIGQGVNLNPQNPVKYESIHLASLSRGESAITLVGRVLDLDHSLESAGAPVDPVTRALRGCTVETTLYLKDSITVEEEVEYSDGTTETVESQEAITHLEMTTVVSNQNGAPLPIFTVHDDWITSLGGTDVFVPYPEWGFSVPDARGAGYPFWVGFFGRISGAAHFAVFSDLDGVLSVGTALDCDPDCRHTMVGKAGHPSQELPAGGALTYFRKTRVFSSSAAADSIHAQLASIFQEFDVPHNPYAELGNAFIRVNFNNAPSGKSEVHQIDAGAMVFDGLLWNSLPDGQSFPLFGSNTADIYLTTPLPPGQYEVRTWAANSQPQIVRAFEAELINEDGDLFQETKSLSVENEGSLITGSPFDVAVEHTLVRFTARNDEGRRLHVRVRAEEAGRDTSGLFGDGNTYQQGDVAYLVDEINSVFFPKGSFQVYASRGPLYNVNVLDIDIDEALDEDGQVVNVVSGTSQDMGLNPAVEFSGYFSADFNVRSASDLEGYLSQSSLLLEGLSEDLDVMFFVDLDHQPRILSAYRTVASLQGAWDEQDSTDRVNSLYDEMAVARCTATEGTLSPETAWASGRFAVLDLPHEEQENYLLLPQLQGDPAQYYDAVRQAFPEALIQVVRPRGPEGFFTSLVALAGGNPGEPLTADNPVLNRVSETGSGTRWGDFDLMLLLAGNEYSEYLQARQDWFNLLNGGLDPRVTGGSGTTRTRNLPVGVVRTWARVSNPEKRDNDLSEFWDSVGRGESFVSNGPLLIAYIGNASFGETAEVNQETSVRIRVRAVPWIPVQELRLVIDGEVVTTLDLRGREEDEILRFSGDVPISLPGPGRHWLVVEAGVPLADLAAPETAPLQGTFSKVYPGHLPLAFSNPIFLHVD